MVTTVQDTDESRHSRSPANINNTLLPQLLQSRARLLVRRRPYMFPCTLGYARNPELQCNDTVYRGHACLNLQQAVSEWMRSVNRSDTVVGACTGLSFLRRTLVSTVYKLKVQFPYVMAQPPLRWQKSLALDETQVAC